MNTFLLLALIVTNALWASAYNRLWSEHVETIGALWASTLDEE